MSLERRLEDIILKHVGSNWFKYAPALARDIVAELALDTETKDLSVFVEEVPRRMVYRGIDLEGVPAKELHFISHVRIKSPWYGSECPDCQDEFGVHDRRHAEILADSLRTALHDWSSDQDD